MDQTQKMSKVMLEFMNMGSSFFKYISSDIEISQPQFATLKIIESSPKITIGELTKALSADQGNVSSMCKTLQKKGYIERVRSSSDERVVTLLLSKQGQDILNTIHNRTYEIIESIGSDCEHFEMDEAIENIYKMINAINHKLIEKNHNKR